MFFFMLTMLLLLLMSVHLESPSMSEKFSSGVVIPLVSILEFKMGMFIRGKKNHFCKCEKFFVPSQSCGFQSHLHR